MKKSMSIKQIFSQTNKLIIVIATFPLLISIFLYSRHIYQYQNIIDNIQTANNIAAKVDDVFLEDMWDIVTGQHSVADNQAYNIVDELKSDIHSIQKNTSTANETSILTVAMQIVQTLDENQQTIIENLQESDSFEKNKILMAQVDANNQLLSDILQEFVRIEINIASTKKSELVNSLMLLTLIEVLLIIGIFYFSQKNSRILNKKIQEPLNDLVEMSHELAKGNLNYRVDLPDTLELATLTESLNSMADDLIKLLEENSIKQYNLAQSEVRVLQAQITPHFVYNSLDAILSLIEQGKYKQAQEMTFALSDFFRISLSKGKDWISLKTEIRHIKDYLTILKIRYGDMLQYTLTVPEHLLDISIPKMILQPIIENAIYHGTKFIRRVGLIEVTVVDATETNELIFTIKDNGIGIKPEELAHIRKELAKGLDNDFTAGYGLYNVNKRLLLYYGSKANIIVESQYRKGTIVTITVPKYQEVKIYV